MIRTVTVTSYISVQGHFMRALPDGRIVVRVGQDDHVGWPVGSQRAKPGRAAVPGQRQGHGTRG